MAVSRSDLIRTISETQQRIGSSRRRARMVEELTNFATHSPGNETLGIMPGWAYTGGVVDLSTSEDPINYKETTSDVKQEQRQPYTHSQIRVMLLSDGGKFNCPICKKKIQRVVNTFYEEDNPHFCSNYLTSEEIKQAQDE